MEPVSDKVARKRTTVVLGARCGKHPDGGVCEGFEYLLTPLFIPNHYCTAGDSDDDEGGDKVVGKKKKPGRPSKNRSCLVNLPVPSSRSDNDCDCKRRKVHGLHACLWHYCLEDAWEHEILPGDAVVFDNLACHFDLQSRRQLFKQQAYMLPLPPKSAPDRSILDNSYFAVVKPVKARMAQIFYEHNKEQVDAMTYPELAALHEGFFKEALKATEHVIPAMARHNNVTGKGNPLEEGIPPEFPFLYREMGVKNARRRPLLPFGRTPVWMEQVEEAGVEEEELEMAGKQFEGPNTGGTPPVVLRRKRGGSITIGGSAPKAPYVDAAESELNPDSSDEEEQTQEKEHERREEEQTLEQTQQEHAEEGVVSVCMLVKQQLILVHT